MYDGKGRGRNTYGVEVGGGGLLFLLEPIVAALASLGQWWQSTQQQDFPTFVLVNDMMESVILEVTIEGGGTRVEEEAAFSSSLKQWTPLTPLL